MGEISNLTAEIETFVRTHDNDQEKLRESPQKSPSKKKEKSPPIPSNKASSQTVMVETKDLRENEVVVDINVIPNNQQTDVVSTERVPTETFTVIDVHNVQKEDEETTDVEVSEIRNRSLVRTSEQTTERRKLIVNSRESPENNEDYPERTSQTPDRDNARRLRKVNSEKQLNVANDVENEQRIETVVPSPPRIIIRKPTEDWEFDEEIRFNDNVKHTDDDEPPKTPISSEVEFILEHDRDSSSSPTVRKSNSDVIEVQTVCMGASGSSSIDTSKEKPKISTKKNLQNSLENFSDVPQENHEHTEQSLPTDVPELKIVESTDDLTDSRPMSQNSDRYKIRFIALKNFSPEPERRDVELRSHNNHEFDVEDVDLPPAPPQRRRSVKDIIASINKSQSLLKMNQPPNGNKETKRSYSMETFPPPTIPTTVSVINNQNSSEPKETASNESITRKFNELDESERKIRKMISDMEKSSIDVPIPVVERFDELNSNNNNSEDLFQKCVVRRDKSSQSGASHDDMEWNPLPKPRRSRNLTHEIENGKM